VEGETDKQRVPYPPFIFFSIRENEQNVSIGDGERVEERREVEERAWQRRGHCRVVSIGGGEEGWAILWHAI
jgi:hypothetical protein